MPKKNYYRKGYLNLVRKYFYYNPKRLSSPNRLALRIKEGYLGLSSALRYYHLLEYEDFTIFIMTKHFQQKVELQGTQYTVNFIPLKEYFHGFEKKEDFYISSLEKTLFDCLLKPKLNLY